MILSMQIQMRSYDIPKCVHIVVKVKRFKILRKLVSSTWMKSLIKMLNFVGLFLLWMMIILW
jgi:hypothetical protein